MDEVRFTTIVTCHREFRIYSSFFAFFCKGESIRNARVNFIKSQVASSDISVRTFFIGQHCNGIRGSHMNQPITGMPKKTPHFQAMSGVLACVSG